MATILWENLLHPPIAAALHVQGIVRILRESEVTDATVGT
jgi:hypothetical protein